MKVIFTDVDGVYNTPAVRATDRTMVMEDKILSVRALAKADDAFVVISSSWRVEFPDEVQALFEGLLHEDWRTIDRPDRNRGLEVADWLARHPETKAYVIIDDHNTFLPEQQPRFVQTLTCRGISANDLVNVKTLLEATPS